MTHPLNAPRNPMAVALAAIGNADGHDPVLRTIAAHRAAHSFTGTESAADLLAAYRTEHARLVQ